MEKYFEINHDGQNIRCKMYSGEKTGFRKIVLYLHGFAGHKDNGAARKFAERVLHKYKGIAVVTFDLPCHGDDVKKTLILKDCMTYMNLVIQYLKETYESPELYAYATSFGGYLVLKYLKDFGNPFVRIALRNPAVNMYELLTETIMKEDDMEIIRKGKEVPVGFDRKINVSGKFLEDLAASDIRKENFIDECEDILIIHGTKDEIVPFEASSAFADDNIIEFIAVEGADHRFQNPKLMETAVKEVISFFGFSS